MAFTLLSRSLRRAFLRPRSLTLTLVLVLLLDAYFITHSRPTPIRTDTLPHHLQNEQIFIVSIARNSEYMLRCYWNEALLNLVQHLGPENVFVSILESGSQEDTKGALVDLQGKLKELGVKNRITLGMDVKQQSQELLNVPPEDGDRTGWIYTGKVNSGWQVRRIPYLANLRNEAMAPLLEMSPEKRFDRVLWINDVVFTTEDVTTLLSTHDGEYASVCALDFGSNPEQYYDTFALRDSAGLKTATGAYPYFFSRASLAALYALSPIPVQSCWNGLISMDATPFYATPPLKFRGVPDSLAREHLEGSECCLIHADNTHLRSQKGNWINPNVRVAFNATSYSKVNGGYELKTPWPEIHDGVEGGDGSIWPGKREALTGVWKNRVAKWTNKLEIWSEHRVVVGRVKKWVAAGQRLHPPEARKELGTECLINEMQVLFENGWKHV